MIDIGRELGLGKDWIEMDWVLYMMNTEYIVHCSTEPYNLKINLGVSQQIRDVCATVTPLLLYKHTDKETESERKRGGRDGLGSHPLIPQSILCIMQSIHI